MNECIGCGEDTFKSVIGNSTCQPCPTGSSSEVGSTYCTCIEGYELIEATCIGT